MNTAAPPPLPSEPPPRIPTRLQDLQFIAGIALYFAWATVLYRLAYAGADEMSVAPTLLAFVLGLVALAVARRFGPRDLADGFIGGIVASLLAGMMLYFLGLLGLL